MSITTLPASLSSPEWQAAPHDPLRSLDHPLRRALLALGVLVAGFGVAAVAVPIGGAVVASGQLGVESHVKRIAHPTGGTIAQIAVQNGDHVRQGQVLIRLDDNVSDAQSQLSRLSVDQLLAQRARLEAERLGAASLEFPPELAWRTDPGAAKAMADELRLFHLHRTEAGGLRAQLDARIAQYGKQIQGYRAQIAALQQQQKLIEPERASVRELWDKRLVTISRVNELERTAVDFEGNIGSLRAEIAQTEARITETREQAIQLGETRRADAGTQLATLNSSLNQEQARHVAATDLQNRSVIRAPYAGIVDKLAFAAKGEVVRPAETILELVPDRDRLLVEAALRPADIDQVGVGRRARIRFTAFNSTATPEVAGTVTFIAPDRTQDAETKASYYPARVAIDPRDLARHRGLRLKPGMPAEVFVETGSRSMLSYITKPLRDQFARAFRDD